MFNNILLAVDGSSHSKKAAKAAAEIARTVGARYLRVVVAYDPLPPFIGEPNLTTAITARTAHANEIYSQTVAAMGKLPLTPSPEVIEGPVAEAILKVARTRKCDLIVMGSRGLGSLRGALLGSNSQKVVSHSTCPVLIIR